MNSFMCPKKHEFGQAPINVTITINEVRTMFSIKRFIKPEKWINKAGIAKGNAEDIRSLNAQIASVRTKLFQHYNTPHDSEKAITAEVVKNSYSELQKKAKLLLKFLNIIIAR